MSVTIPDLWPDVVTVSEVLTPCAVLKYQAGQLRKRSKGLLEAEVITEDRDKTTHHFLELVAPALDRYRFRLLDAWHGYDFVYPVTVHSTVKDEKPATLPEVLVRAIAADSGPPVAATQEEFLKLIGEILGSNKAKSLIQSLIAKSNDAESARRPDQTPPSP